MLKKKRLLLLPLVAAALLVVACKPKAVKENMESPLEATRIVTETAVAESQIVEVTRAVVTGAVTEALPTGTPEKPVPAEPVTLNGFDTSDLPTLDPQIAEDVISINYIANLFVTLTRYDLATTSIRPEAATGWDISDDGLVYTFHLRPDIPWVYYNPATGETTQEVNEEGNPRFVTADDFVYSIKRACQPHIGSKNNSVFAPYIRGCSAVLDYEDPTAVPPELVDAIGVSAPDPATLVINLEFPASFFLSMTPMWSLAASPQWAIEEHGDSWVEAGNIITSGRYVLHEWDHQARRIMRRNPLMPADMQGRGNIEKFVVNVVPDIDAGYDLWLNNQVDYGHIPDAELQTHRELYPNETDQISDLIVFYIAFRMTKPPFNDIHVRRAFSAAFDRQAFVEQVRQDQGFPMIHFAPPGIFGAPPIDTVGVGYDPEFARAELEAAGYPDCAGFPEVTLLGNNSQSTLEWIEFAQANWEENLGCSVDLIRIEQVAVNDLLAVTAADIPSVEAPHMWMLGWKPDYPDANNLVGDVLWCKSANRFMRTCSDIDDLIALARAELDLVARTEMYRQIEEMFFGPEGEYPLLPMFVSATFIARHSWLTRTPALFGGEQWYTWQINQTDQLEAVGH